MALKTISWTTTVVEEYRITVQESDLPKDIGDMDSYLASFEEAENRRIVSVENRDYDILEA